MTGGDAASLPAESLGRLLKRTEQAVLRAKSAAVKAAGITLAQYVALAELDARPGITSAELARACLVSPQAMMVLLKGMEEQGLAERRRHPRHQTVLEVYLTDVGRECLVEARRHAAPVERRLDEALSVEESATLRSLLERLARATRE
jgi:DNA-binding MarR family transcriptional regulator